MEGDSVSKEGEERAPLGPLPPPPPSSSSLASHASTPGEVATDEARANVPLIYPTVLAAAERETAERAKDDDEVGPQFDPNFVVDATMSRPVRLDSVAKKSAPTGPLMHEEWMTQLPQGGPNRRKLDFDVMQKSVTSFSRHEVGVQSAEDIAAWTRHPGDASDPPQSGKMTLEEAKRKARERGAGLKAREAEAQVEQAKVAQHSLLQEHLHKLTKETKKKSKRDDGSSSSSSEESDESSESSRSSSDERKRKRSKSRDKKKHRRSTKDKKSDKEKRKKRKRKDKDDGKRRSKKAKTEGKGARPSVKGRDEAPAPYWDRDRDLLSSRVDPNKRNRMIAEAGYLKDRFGSAQSTTSFL